MSSGEDASSDAKERIVNAAIEVFLEKGYGGTRVADIAEKAGYTSGALYVHFPNRTALLAEAIVIEGRRVLGQLIGELSKATPGEGGLATLMADNMCRPGSTIDRLLIEALALAARNDEARDMLGSALGQFGDMINDQLEAASQAGLLDPSLDVPALRAFFSAWILGLVVLRAIGFDPPGVEAMRDVCLRMTSSLGRG